MTKISGKFYPLQHDEWIRACQELTPSRRDVLYFIRTLDPYGNGVKITAAEIARQLSTPEKIVHRQTISRALKELVEREFIPDNYLPSTTPNENLEARICKILQSKLGGLIEVSTPVGRIDLLTNTEIIEVKRFSDWKAALGQILVYSAFYPEHQKRIHLFGSSNELKKLADIEIACLEFNIRVTGEVLQLVEVRDEKP
jgi:hypothetical protein